VETGRVDVNATALPRAYFPKNVDPVITESESRSALETLDPSARSVVLTPPSRIEQDAGGDVEILRHDEQTYQIRYRAASPSLLTISQAWYPGWHASIASAELPVVRVDHALMGVIVPPGENKLDLYFRPRFFLAGIIFSSTGATWVSLAVIF